MGFSSFLSREKEGDRENSKDHSSFPFVYLLLPFTRIRETTFGGGEKEEEALSLESSGVSISDQEGFFV